MQLIYVHAPDRCAPCRDMDERIVQVIRRRPDLDPVARDRVLWLHADHNAEEVERKLGPVKVIPAFALVSSTGDVLYRSEGRISETLLEHLLEAVRVGIWTPSEFPPEAPSAPLVFNRSYARRGENGQREFYCEAIARTVGAIADLGNFTDEERLAVLREAQGLRCLPSGRALWVGGSDWAKKPENHFGFYNCVSITVDDTEAFGLLMDLAMQGTGTGAVLEDDVVAKLPPVRRTLRITKTIPIGEVGGSAETVVRTAGRGRTLQVGDSRKGWVDAYMQVIHWATAEAGPEEWTFTLDLSQIRPPGERLHGFGGTANPVKLGEMFQKVVALLNGAVGRQLTPVEASLLIDEAASCVVAGNIRRSAGMRQFSFDNQEAAHCKDNLYTQVDGTWKVDPKREALRMANHTRVAHRKPTLEEIRESVRKQFASGEGAIMYAPEAVARGNADLLGDPEDREAFLELYEQGAGRDFLCSLMDAVDPDQDPDEKQRELDHRIRRYGVNPCAEITGKDFTCNLAEVHLNRINPRDLDAQERAFQAAAMQVCALLHHKFVPERMQYSREIDPIVGVSFTGLFDFFVELFGEPWLAWMMAGRPEDHPRATEFAGIEKGLLSRWRDTVIEAVSDYCLVEGLRVPNRCTTVQPAGSKSLLTGASSGWHPPKAQRFIRRITFGANDPVALAARDLGYNVIPAQSAVDEEGRLLDDINDPRVREWLVEIPTEVPWANKEGCDQHDLSKLPVEAQMGLYMQVQRHYATHATSGTIEFREEEIDTLAELIHEAIGTGYVGVALLARFDANETFPRLPFQPIDKATFDRLQQEVLERRVTDDFHAALARYDNPETELSPQDSACASGACLARADRDEALALSVS